MHRWDWNVTKTAFSRLDADLKNLAGLGFEIYQIIAVQEVKPARVPFEVVIISRKSVEIAEPIAGKPFQMKYSPED